MRLGVTVDVIEHVGGQDNIDSQGFDAAFRGRDQDGDAVATL